MIFTVLSAVLLVIGVILLVKLLEYKEDKRDLQRRLKASIETAKLISESYKQQIIKLKQRIFELENPPPSASGIYNEKADSPDGWERCF